MNHVTCACLASIYGRRGLEAVTRRHRHSLAPTAVFSSAFCALLNLALIPASSSNQVSPMKQTHRAGTGEEELGYLCCTISCKILNLGKALFF